MFGSRGAIVSGVFVGVPAGGPTISILRSKEDEDCSKFRLRHLGENQYMTLINAYGATHELSKDADHHIGNKTAASLSK